MVKPLRIGITGSNGFLGKNLVKTLNLCGYQVVEFTTKPQNQNQKVLNFSDVDSMKTEFLKIDILIHAAWTSGSRPDRQNPELQNLNKVIGEKIANAALRANIKKIIGVGSQDELNTSFTPWADNEPFNPQSYYSEAKLVTYNHFLKATNELLWVRLLSIYGAADPRDWVIMNAVKSLKTKKEFKVGGCEQLFSLTHVADAADGFHHLIQHKVLGTVNVSTLEATSLKASLELLEKLSGHTGFIKYVGNSDERNQIRSPGVLEKIGWSPNVSKEFGFRELLEYQD